MALDDPPPFRSDLLCCLVQATPVAAYTCICLHSVICAIRSSCRVSLALDAIASNADGDCDDDDTRLWCMQVERSM